MHIEKIYADHREEVNALRAKLGDLSKEQLDEMRRTHAEELRKLGETHMELVTSLKTDHVAQVEELHAVSRKEADALQVTKAEAEVKAAEQRKALEGLVTSERKQVAAARLQTEEANKREIEPRRKVSAFEVAQRELEAAHETGVQRLRQETERRQETEHLLATHLQETKDL